MNIYVKDIIEICNAKLICGNPDLECVNFSKDTRTILENDVYVAIKGEKFDGNDYYEEAFLKGASACILDNIDLNNFDYQKYSDKTILLVEDSIKCLWQLASFKRSKYNIEVVAITGSVGKTSTKDMVANVLSQKYRVLKTSGNNNNHIGLPLTILKLKDEEVLVVEMGMNHFKEISLLTNIAKPTIAIITNIGTSHVGNLGSRENILKAKLEIVEGLSKDGILIVNNDNDLLHNLKIDNTNILTVGIDNKSTYMAQDIKIMNESMTFNVNDNNKLININLNIGATPFVYNSLIAYAVGRILNLDENAIKRGIETVELSKNRLAKINMKKGYTIIDDTYNASYDSMKLALNILKNTKGKRKIAVLGDMLELGDYTKEMHEKIASEIINNDIDIVITIGNYSKYIDEKLIELNFSKDNLFHFDKESDTYKILDKLFEKDDVVLFKSSHAIGLTNIVNYLLKMEE